MKREFLSILFFFPLICFGQVYVTDNPYVSSSNCDYCRIAKVIVTEKEKLSVELVGDEKTLKFEPLMIIDGEKIQVGQPVVKGAVVEAKVLEESVKDDKVIAIRYKAKKRVNKKRGHRQQHSIIEITKIS